MKKNILYLILIFLLALPEMANALETYRYRDKKLRFSADIPKTWEKELDAEDPNLIRFRSPKENETDLRENISFSVFPLVPESLTLEELEAAYITDLKKKMRAFKVLDEGRDMGKDGKEAIWALYTFKVGDFTGKQIVYFKKQGGRGAYIIDTAIDETYSQFQTIFNEINASFHLE